MKRIRFSKSMLIKHQQYISKIFDYSFVYLIFRLNIKRQNKYKQINKTVNMYKLKKLVKKILKFKRKFMQQKCRQSAYSKLRNKCTHRDVTK